MTNKEAIEQLKWVKKRICDITYSPESFEALNVAINALEKDKCSSCKHYDKDYGETCLNPEGTCRVFEYDGYEEAENETN